MDVQYFSSPCSHEIGGEDAHEASQTNNIWLIWRQEITDFCFKRGAILPEEFMINRASRHTALRRAA